MSGQSGQEREGRRRFSLASSGLLTALILAAVLGTIGLVWTAHLRGRLHKFSTVEIPPDNSSLPRPGGQDLLMLHRMAPADNMTPQFSDLVMMPGVGMGVLQLNVDLPGRDPEGILVGTPVEHLGAAFQPANKPTSALRFSMFSLKVFPLDGSGEGEELLGTRPAQQFRTDILPGGTGATAEFSSAPPPDSSGVAPRPSGIDTTVSSTISDRGFDVSVSAKNVSQQAKAVTIAWTPVFTALSGALDKMQIRPPETIAPSPDNKPESRRIPLGTKDFHRVWTGLKYSYLSMGPELQLQNLAEGYTLKMIALTPSIRSVQVDASSEAKSVSISFSTEGEAGRRTVIEPGETLLWRLRIQATPNDGYAQATN